MAISDIHYFHENIPQNLTIPSVAKKLGISCPQIFVSAIVKDIDKPFREMDKNEIYSLAQAACRTQNPDIIWQIFRVETHFRVYIININGQKTLTGQDAKKFLENGIKNDEKIDIGPLQINWRANGSHYSYKPSEYFKGDFSVEFIAKNLLKNFVRSCKTDWVNCYHSYNETRGKLYRSKIENAGNKLREILLSFLRL